MKFNNNLYLLLVLIVNFLFEITDAQDYNIVNIGSEGFDLELTPPESRSGYFRYMVIPPGADPTPAEVSAATGICGGEIQYQNSDSFPITVSVACPEIEAGTYDVWVALDISDSSTMVQPTKQVLIPEPLPTVQTFYAYLPSQTGFSLSYDIDHPNALGKMYFYVQPNDLSVPSLNDVLSCASGTCCGSYQQTDPAPTVTHEVACALTAGTIYHVYGVIDTDGSGANAAFVNNAQPLDLPLEATPDPSKAPTTTVPSSEPTVSSPTEMPTSPPTSSIPTIDPSPSPTSSIPSNVPSSPPSSLSTDFPSPIPTELPTPCPTHIPTDMPTPGPSGMPSPSDPTSSPASGSSTAPTNLPTDPSTTTDPSNTPTSSSTTTTTTSPRVLRNLPLGSICGENRFCNSMFHCRKSYDGLNRCVCPLPCGERELEHECEDLWSQEMCARDGCCVWIGHANAGICEYKAEIKCEDLPAQACTAFPCDCIWMMEEGGQCENLEIEYEGFYPHYLQQAKPQSIAETQTNSDGNPKILKLAIPEKWQIEYERTFKYVIGGIVLFWLAFMGTVNFCLYNDYIIDPSSRNSNRISSQEALIDYVTFDTDDENESNS